MTDPSRSSREKVRAHRERLRQQGLRPIQIWVPDVRSKAGRLDDVDVLRLNQAILVFLGLARSSRAPR